MTNESPSHASRDGESSDQFDWTDFDRLLDEFKLPEPGAWRGAAAASAVETGRDSAEPADATAGASPAVRTVSDFEAAFAEEMLAGQPDDALNDGTSDVDGVPATSAAPSGPRERGAGAGPGRRPTGELLARLGRARPRVPQFAGQHRVIAGAAFALLLLAGTSFGVAYLAPSDGGDAVPTTLGDRDARQEPALAGAFDAPTFFAAPEQDEGRDDIAVRVVRTEKIVARLTSEEAPEGLARSAVKTAVSTRDPSDTAAQPDLDVAAAEAMLTAAPEVAARTDAPSTAPVVGEEPVIPSPAPRPVGADKGSGNDAVASASGGAAAGGTRAAAVGRANSEALPRTAGDSAEVERLLEQGRALMEGGNIASARIVFEQVVEAGDPRGARAMGMTFDPDIYARLPVLGLKTDEEKARLWYARATDMAGGAALPGGS